MKALAEVEGKAGAQLKCANPACTEPDHLAGTGEFFRLESLAARECVTHRGIHGASVESHPRLQIEDYWLCARCAELFTLQYDHATSEVVGVPRPPHHAHQHYCGGILN